MVEIKQEFEKTYGKPLDKFIQVLLHRWSFKATLLMPKHPQDDTSGIYKDALIALIGGK